MVPHFDEICEKKKREKYGRTGWGRRGKKKRERENYTVYILVPSHILWFRPWRPWREWQRRNEFVGNNSLAAWTQRLKESRRGAFTIYIYIYAIHRIEISELLYICAPEITSLIFQSAMCYRFVDISLFRSYLVALSLCACIYLPSDSCGGEE